MNFRMELHAEDARRIVDNRGDSKRRDPADDLKT